MYYLLTSSPSSIRVVDAVVIHGAVFKNDLQ